MVRIVAAIVLLTAAALKCHQLATEPTIGTGLLESRWFLMATVEAELFASIWLLADIWAKPTWAAVLALFGLFMCVSLYKAISGHATCGCFGRVPVNPWYTRILDVAIVLSLLCWRPKERGLSQFLSDENRTVPLARGLAVLLAWLAVGLPAAYAMGSYADARLSDAGEILGDGSLVVLEPEDWGGRQLPLLPFIDIGERLSRGRWLAVLYRHDCPRCQEAIRQVMDQGQGGADGAPTLALIEVPPYAVPARPLGSGSVVRGRLSEAQDWFLQTPCFLSLRDGRVVAEGRPGATSQRPGMESLMSQPTFWRSK